MIFHRLRVISFSKSLLSTKVSNRKKSDVKAHNKDVLKADEELTHKEAHNKKDVNENKTVYIQNNSRSVDPVPRSQYKSKSETFRTPSKTLKNHTNKKSLSLNDLKTHLSLIDFVSFNQIKQKVQTYRKQKAIKKVKKHDVKVLYVAESRPRNKRRSNKHHKIQDILQPSDNLFGFYRSKRLIDLHMFSHSYNKKNNPFQKLKTRSVRKRKKLQEASTDYSHHPLKVITSSRIRVSQSYMASGCNGPHHYNILRFPQTTKSKTRQKTSFLKLYRSEALTNDNLSIDKKKTHKVSRGQIASTSILKAPVICVDEAVSTCKSVKLLKSSKSVKVKTALLKSSNERQKCNRSRRKFRIMNIYSKIFHKLLTGTVSAHPKQRTIAKHILICLVLLAWSPCIFSIGVCWVISYPLKLQHVISTCNRNKYSRRKDSHATHCQYDWWSAFTNYTRSLTKETKKALSSLLLLEEQSKLEDLPHRPHPDPRRRYTLFHAQDRGWVIRPVRVCERLHPKQSRFMQIFQNWFCNCNHRTSTTSPGQRTSKIKHRASSHATCRKTCDKKYMPGKQMDSKHGDCVCLDPSKSTATQKPGLTCKPCAQADETIFKKKTCKKLNTKREDKVCTTPAKTPATPQNKEIISKPCFRRDDLYFSCKPCQTEPGTKNVAEKLDKTPKSGEGPHKKICECRNGAKKPSDNNRSKSPNTPQSKSAQLLIPKSAGETCPSCTIATKKSVSEKLLETEREDKVKLFLEKQNPIKKINVEHNALRKKAKFSRLMETKRSRSATKLRRRDPELVLPITARSRSVSKKNCKSKPDHIVERGPVTGSGDPQKVITKSIKQNMQSGPKKPAAKSTKDRTPPKATTVAPVPHPNKSKTVFVQTSSKNEKVKISYPKNKKIQKEKRSKRKKIPFGQRFMAWIRGLYRNTAESVSSYDKDLQKSFFPADARCGDLYIYTLRSRPCFWIYKASPSFYPWFLRFYYCSKTCCSHCLFSISLCLSAPIAFCCYGCYQLCSCCCGC